MPVRCAGERIPMPSRERTPMLRKCYTSREMPSTNTSTTGCKTNEAWIDEVRKNVNLARPMDHPKSPCTIFKVPESIRQLVPKAYEPVIASLGPFHHNRCGSSFMKYHKWQCVRHLLSRHGSPEHASHLLNECLLELKKQNEMVRSCYSEEFSALNDQDMALIMLLDGCFIIDLMLRRCPEKESLKERKKDKGMEEEAEVENRVGKLEGEIAEEDGGKKRRGCMTEIREGEVVLNIGEKEEQLEGPTVAGLFTLGLVVFDLLKLENQIPFFIIQLLFDHLKTSKDGKIDLVDLALQLFEGIHPKESRSFKKKSLGEYHHLLHLFYSSRIPSQKPTESTSAPGCICHTIECMMSKWKKAEVAPSQGASASAPGCISSIIEHMKPKRKKAEEYPSQETPTSAPKWIPTAAKLDRAGVKFKRKESADSFLNITFAQRKMRLTPLQCLWKLYLMFRSGRMEIPPLQIYDYTSPLLRNLIAFEQCYFDTEMYITIYALFMDSIINQAEDARLLHLEGILEHKLSNDQAVAELFNQLGNQICFDPEKIYLANQIKEVNEFCDIKWHKWLAALRRDYLGNPWTTISVLAAIFLLLLTMEQAVFSALSMFTLHRSH